VGAVSAHFAHERELLREIIAQCEREGLSNSGDLTFEEIGKILERPTMLEQTLMLGFYRVCTFLNPGAEISIEDFDVRKLSKEFAEYNL